ncbi:MAG TPA: universal stress protein [Chitinophagaceae bacterium]|nr:universal stress protein [Chitinophagaceae bacterium]
MENILVPIDFSATAKNAAHYAIEFAKQMQAKKIILYNAYQTPPAVDVNMAVVETIDVAALKEISEKQMEDFRMTLYPFCAKGMELTTICEYGYLRSNVNEVCHETKTDIIVMGVTGAGKVTESIMGSTAVDVARASEVPVIIVPPGASYTKIEEVMLACDFKKVVETTPVGPLKKILDETHAKLFVLNVDHAQRNFKPDTPFESLMLDTLLHGYNPEYIFKDSENFVEAINETALEKQVDLIITIPKKMGWFDHIFHRSHTKQLAFHSHVPIMVMHE